MTKWLLSPNDVKPLVYADQISVTFLANITYVILMCRGNLSLRKKYKFIFFEIFILLVN